MSEKRLSKALAAAGIASRRACEEIIFQGRVSVNGEVVRLPQTLVQWGTDEIIVDGAKCKGEEQKIYYMLNKPKGFVCSNVRVSPTSRIILDIFPHSKRLFTIGRLDKETSGLLLVTNDGQFANEVIHPSSNIIKEYLLKVSQEVSPEHLSILSRGARIEKRWVKPAIVKKVRRGTLRICIKEGKKHEVRILAERAKLNVVDLKRIRIGSLTLGPLAEGSFRVLTKKDRELIFS